MNETPSSVRATLLIAYAITAAAAFLFYAVGTPAHRRAIACIERGYDKECVEVTR